MSPLVLHLWPSGTQEYGITAVNAGTNTVVEDRRFGMRFTVGAAALTLNRLRYYAKTADTYRVTIHRDSDETIMATADIVVAAGEVDSWREETISATLAAGGVYTISARPLSGAVAIYRNPIVDSLVYNAAITFGSYRYGGVVDTRPLTSTTATYWPSDFGFLT